eukprot:TRINITY_DN15153_c0_g1_i1.p1 TRINITY_DN15153_c0_g1~~TRINITY_DN15153_c0_g1_i1.p1  ORF type:complete len:398 (-),score=78.55 TRINITY_DN15153_c0_g1_i1:115-1308(-)
MTSIPSNNDPAPSAYDGSAGQTGLQQGSELLSSIVVGSLSAAFIIFICVSYVIDELRNNGRLSQFSCSKKKKTEFDARRSDFSQETQENSMRLTMYKTIFIGRILVFSTSASYLIFNLAGWSLPQNPTVGCTALAGMQGLTYYCSRFFSYLFLLLRFELVNAKKHTQSRIFEFSVFLASLGNLVIGFTQAGTEEIDFSGGYCDTDGTLISEQLILAFIWLDIAINLVLLVAFIIPLYTLSLGGECTPQDAQRREEFILVIRRNSMACFITLMVSATSNYVYWMASQGQAEWALRVTDNFQAMDMLFHCLATLSTHKRFKLILLCAWNKPLRPKDTSSKNPSGFPRASDDEVPSILGIMSKTTVLPPNQTLGPRLTARDSFLSLFSGSFTGRITGAPH